MIVIIGAGVVGLVLANALARANLPVTVVETSLPDLHWDNSQLDARVSAINAVSQQILMNLGVWSRIDPAAYAPLRALQVWDSSGGGAIHFDSADIGEPQLGFIVENRALIKALWETAESLSQVTILAPRQPVKIIHSLTQLQLQLEDQTVIPAQLIVGADGGHSWVREEMSINSRERSYEQQALVAVAHTVRAHQNTGWQSFLPAGPLGVLPLADNQTTAIVWSNTLLEAQRLMGLPVMDFNDELSAALNHRLGAMTLLTPLKLIPLVMRHAQEYVLPRLALIGDAAHTIHPLAGQGVNLGFLDAAVLAQVIIEARQKQQDIGSLRVLRRYQRWRKGDNTLMLAAMSGFKELFAQNSPWIVQLRSQGLNLTNRLDVLKNPIMSYAIGHKGDLPELAKAKALSLFNRADR
jgi:2-polyprenylphenol 6-hydroxylase